MLGHKDLHLFSNMHHLPVCIVVVGSTATLLSLPTSARESYTHPLAKPMTNYLPAPISIRQCDLRTGWRAKMEDENVDRRSPSGLGDVTGEGDAGTAANVQKKIMPWEQGLDQGLVYTETQRLAGMYRNASVDMMAYSSHQWMMLNPRMLLRHRRAAKSPSQPPGPGRIAHRQDTEPGRYAMMVTPALWFPELAFSAHACLILEAHTRVILMAVKPRVIPRSL
jgi:hypothetical protein